MVQRSLHPPVHQGWRSQRGLLPGEQLQHRGLCQREGQLCRPGLGHPGQLLLRPPDWAVMGQQERSCLRLWKWTGTKSCGFCSGPPRLPTCMACMSHDTLFPDPSLQDAVAEKFPQANNFQPCPSIAANVTVARCQSPCFGLTILKDSGTMV